MHGMGAHSAMALKRQRNRQRQGPGDRRRSSVSSVYKPAMPQKVMSTITCAHVGVIFIVIGLFFMTGALVPNEEKKKFNAKEMIGTGITLLVIGIFLIVINQFYGQREEDELTNYVESRLARTKSGQRLYRDEESICESLNRRNQEDGMAMEPTSSKNKRKKGRGGRSGPVDKLEVVKEKRSSSRNNSNSASSCSSKSLGAPRRSASNTPSVNNANSPLDRIQESAASSHTTPRGSPYVVPSSSAAEDRSTDLYRVYDREYARAGA